MLRCNRFYVEPTVSLMNQSREKESFKPSKVVMKEHKRPNSLFIIITSEDNMQAFKRAENKNSNRQESAASTLDDILGCYTVNFY